MNLHAIVRSVIPIVHPDETVTWYRSTGQQAVDWGQVTRSYAAGVQLVAQVQSEGDAALYYANRAGENSIIRKFYLMADPSTPPASIVRPEARSGDFLRRRDGRFWYVDAVEEDFSANAGWVCVRGVLQDTIPAELQAVVDAETPPEPEPEPEVYFSDSEQEIRVGDSDGIVDTMSVRLQAGSPASLSVSTEDNPDETMFLFVVVTAVPDDPDAPEVERSVLYEDAAGLVIEGADIAVGESVSYADIPLDIRYANPTEEYPGGVTYRYGTFSVEWSREDTHLFSVAVTWFPPEGTEGGEDGGD